MSYIVAFDNPELQTGVTKSFPRKECLPSPTNSADNEHTGIEPVKLPTKCPEGGAPDFAIRHRQNRNTK